MRIYGVRHRSEAPKLAGRNEGTMERTRHSVAARSSRKHALPNRLIASRQVEGRGVQIASYISRVIRSAPCGSTLRASARLLASDKRGLCQSAQRPAPATECLIRGKQRSARPAPSAALDLRAARQGR